MKVEIRATQTFTDLACPTPEGKVWLRLPTRETAPLAAIAELLKSFKEKGHRASEIVLFSDWEATFLSHPQSTDAALLVTEGFEDILNFSRSKRTDGLSLAPRVSSALLPSTHIFGVSPRGQTPTSEELEFLASKLKMAQIKWVGIALLGDPHLAESEEKIAEGLISKGIEVFCSSKIFPKLNELERAQKLAQEILLKSFWSTRRTELDSLFEGLPWRHNPIPAEGFPQSRIVEVDALGLLKISPVETGAEPGPSLLGRSNKVTLFDGLYLKGKVKLEDFFPYKNQPDETKLKSELALMAKQLGGSTESVIEAIAQMAHPEGTVWNSKPRWELPEVSVLKLLFENILENPDEGTLGLHLFDGKRNLLHASVKSYAYLAAPGLILESSSKYLGNLFPDDVLICNDPYSGGVALHVVCLAIPIFLGKSSEPDFFLASMRPIPELDKSFDTVNLPTRTEAEGIRIPATKFHEKDKINQELLQYLETQGSPRISTLLADQIQELKNCAQKLKTHLKGLDSSSVSSGVKQLLNISEKGALRFLSEIPDGDYEFHDVLDADGKNHSNLRLQLKLSLHEKALGFNFFGTAKQTSGLMNTPYSLTLGACWGSFLMLAQNRLPLNSGTFRPLSVVAPENSLLHPAYPAAVRGGLVCGFPRVMDVILGAASKAFPFLVPAAGEGGNTLLACKTDGALWVEEIPGGTGSSKENAGLSGVSFYELQTPVISVEDLEKTFPVQVTQWHWRHGSAGKGKHLAGHGITKAYKFLKKTRVTLLGQRFFSRPYGLFGGVPGLELEVLLQASPNQKAQVLDVREGAWELAEGQTLIINTPGGGGWGKST